jgi:hypothetical protein
MLWRACGTFENFFVDVQLVDKGINMARREYTSPQLLVVCV